MAFLLYKWPYFPKSQIAKRKTITAKLKSRRIKHVWFDPPWSILMFPSCSDTETMNDISIQMFRVKMYQHSQYNNGDDFRGKGMVNG